MNTIDWKTFLIWVNYGPNELSKYFGENRPKKKQTKQKQESINIYQIHHRLSFTAWLLTIRPKHMFFDELLSCHSLSWYILLWIFTNTITSYDTMMNIDLFVCFIIVCPYLHIILGRFILQNKKKTFLYLHNTAR